MEESKVKTVRSIEYFIEHNRKICWESEYENGEFCIGENKVRKFMSDTQSHITKLEAENFKLAAYQCDKPYGDDYGNKRCTYQDRILELEARNKELEEALRTINNLKSHNSRSTGNRFMMSTEIAEQVLKT